MSQNKSFRNPGALLREARLTKNISLEAATKRTRIHINILKAIENDDYKTLGSVYVKGFLKIYAEYLGVDKEEILQAFQNVSSNNDISSVRRVIFPAQEPSVMRPVSVADSRERPNILKKIDFKLLAIVILLLFVVLGFMRIVKHRRAALPAAGLTVSEKVTAKKITPPPVAPIIPKTVQKTSSKTASSSKPSPVKTTGEVARETQKEKIVLVIRAKDKCWLKVKVDGKVVFQHVLARGTAESWQANEKIELVIGNAGALQFELNGRVLEKIGRPGQTLKHVIVTKDGLTIQN